LRQADLDEVRVMPNPPAGVRLTMQAACIMFDVKPVIRDDPAQLGKKIKDWWSAGYKTLLSGAGLCVWTYAGSIAWPLCFFRRSAYYE
jgi:dynein heavy chain